MDRRFLRPGWIAGHVLVLAAVLTCLRLGWWQWERTHEATGTAQNFGYALLWPAFGAAFIYMWVRFLHLEVLKDDEENEATDRDLRELLDAYGPAPSPASNGVPATQQTPNRDSAAGSDDDAAPGQETVAGEPETEPADTTSTAGPRRPRQQRPSQAVTISVAMVGEDDDDDPELAAYNQVLAALAEEDRRRAR